MGTSTVQLPDGELEFVNDGEWVTSDLPQPDPKWSAVDSNGHEHRYTEGSDRYPSLKSVAGELYWCEDCQDEEFDTWYECRLCGEKVEPGTRVDHTPVWVSRGSRYYWNGEPISHERANEIIAAMQQARDDAARMTERPAIGSRVRFGDNTVTVVPVASGASDDHVTVMQDGTGAMETVALERLRKLRP